MKNIKDIVKDPEYQERLKNKKAYISREFQDYGYRLALKLGDLKHKSLYIKLAKETPRALLEQAYSFAVDYPNAKNKGRLFMWKLKQLKAETKKSNKKQA